MVFGGKSCENQRPSGQSPHHPLNHKDLSTPPLIVSPKPPPSCAHQRLPRTGIHYYLHHHELLLMKVVVKRNIPPLNAPSSSQAPSCHSFKARLYRQSHPSFIMRARTPATYSSSARVNDSSEWASGAVCCPNLFCDCMLSRIASFY